MIIHATNIDITSPDYYYSEAISEKPENIKYRYYQGIITVIGEKKERIELDFEAFAKHCIKLSNKVKENNNG